jgi:hypothetical protein
MHLWTSLTSHFGNKPKPTNTKVINKMNNSEYHSNETRVRIERSQTIPLSPSNERASNPLPRRRVDPSQTLQLPIPESQKAETPFVNPLGAYLHHLTLQSAPTPNFHHQNEHHIASSKQQRSLGVMGKTMEHGKAAA